MIKSHLVFTQIILSLLIALPLMAQEQESDEQKKAKYPKSDYILCKNRRFARTVNVKWDSQKKECETHYSKFGNTRVVGSGRNLTSCRQFLNNIRFNLEKAGWECRSIEGAKVADSNE